MTFYLFNLPITCYVIPDVICYCIFVNVVFSDEDKILIKNYISWKDMMQDSRGQNFRTKNGRKVALTGCSRSSETQAQWTDVGAAADREVPARMKTLTR